MGSDSQAKSVGKHVASIVKLGFLIMCASLSLLLLVFQQIFQVTDNHFFGHMFIFI